MAAVSNFGEWRNQARDYLARNVAPADAVFSDQWADSGLFDDCSQSQNKGPGTTRFRIPKSFFNLAETVAYHRDDRRWDLLYRILWRVTHGEPNLMEIESDDDVHRALAMEKAVRRDAHKMKAFVRFHRVVADVGEHFIAWHRPDHRIVRMTAPFFSRRFPAMNWSIMTPDESVTWNQKELQYGPGMPVSAAPLGDELEDLWKQYYRSTFNPARIKLKMMKREMPVRHWPTLPETQLIPDLLQEASSRVELMVTRSEGSAESAADFIPADADWSTLRAASSTCRGCELCQFATQTVFGEGPSTASIVLVGEQPGDQEDRAGMPFVGPAGEVLSAAFEEASIDRDEVYLTNAVKHFKFEERGKARLHKKPRIREVIACRPWLLAELGLIQPKVIVCLGATAAQSIIGRDFRIHQSRGKIVQTELCSLTIATYHPASILRVQEPNRSTMKEALIADLKLANQLTKGD